MQGEAKSTEEEEEGTVTRGNPVWKATHITEISEDLEPEEMAPVDLPAESSLYFDPLSCILLYNTIGGKHTLCI